ncbi:MAG TPA: GGDEF domain-containing protein [Thermoleophilaceae bacterium]|nr:GGDEF domain-containing protein [Thermoleophilaceae bacterium]
MPGTQTHDAQASLLPRLHPFTATVLIAGLTTAGALAPSAVEVARDASAATWALVALAVLSEALRVAVPGGRSLTDMTFSSCFGLTLLATTGIGGALIAVVFSNAVCDVAIARRPTSAAYNTAQYTLAWAAAAAVLALCGFDPGQPDPSSATLWALALAGAAFFVVNNGLVMTTEACELRGGLARHLRPGLAFAAWIELSCLGVAILVVLAGVTLATAPLLLLPVLAHRAGRRALQADHERLHDELTGLPNRSHLRACAGHAIRRAARQGTGGTLMVLDLNGFKRVNDARGHAAGDALLQEVARRLRASIREGDTVARLGGDEFAVLLPGHANRRTARAAAYGIADRIARPIPLGGEEHRVGASIGIVRYPDDGDDLDTLLERADRAMYAAKRRTATASSRSGDMPRSAAGISG